MNSAFCEFIDITFEKWLIRIMIKEKKKYIKPEIKKIKLDAKTAVLAVCKTSGSFGRSGGNCGPPIFQPCQDNGS